MERISALVQILLLFSIFTINVEQVAASNTIYIRADGSIDPVSANITSADNITYTFTDHNYDEIVIERNNIFIDGNGFTLHGSGLGHGVNMVNAVNITVKNLIILNFTRGFFVDSSYLINLLGNTLSNHEMGYGIYIKNSTNAKILGNNITENYDGILLISNSINCTIAENNLVENDHAGLVISSSSNNTISCNNITNNDWCGIHFNASSNYNTISANDITANKWEGIYFEYSSFNTIAGNNIINNDFGIWLSYSSNNMISGNDITANNLDGVFFFPFCDYNTISGNNITANNWIGVDLQYSSFTTISGNNITANIDFAIMFFYAPDNRLYHNNIIDNNVQVYLSFSVNVSDDGCEGNYWSDYNGTDLDSDGVGDTELPWWGVDSHPLMNSYWNPSDIDHDLDVDIFDVVAVADAYGSTPSDPHWNCHGDITQPYGIIDIFDIVLLVGSYGEEYSS